MLRDAAQSVCHGMPWPIVVPVEEQDQVDLRDVLLPVLTSLVCLRASSCFVFLPEVAAEQLKDFALSFIVEIFEIHNGVQVKQSEHIAQNRLVEARTETAHN